MSLTKRHTLVFAALSAFVLLALAACTVSASSSPTASPEPSATATATPVPIKSIPIDPNQDPDGFLAALPPVEVQCAASAVGGADVLAKLTADPNDSSISVSDTQFQVMAACFSDQTIKGIIVGQLELQTGGLSDETRSCISQHAAGIDLSAMFSESAADAGTFVSLAQSLFCLNSDERAAFETSAGGFIDASEFSDIDALECVSNTIGIDSFSSIADAFTDESGGEGSVDFSVLGSVMPAMISCGVVTDEDLQDTGITADQMSCLLGKLDPEVMASLMAGTQGDGETPDLATLASALSVFDECGLDLQAILDANASAGLDDPDPTAPGLNTADVPSVSVDDVACLTDHGVSLDVAAKYAAGLMDASADATLDAAVEACAAEDGTGTPEPSLIDLLPVTTEQAQCLVANVSEEQLQGIADGTVSPLVILPVLQTCDISIEDLLNAVS